MHFGLVEYSNFSNKYSSNAALIRGEALIRGRRLFEARRLLEEIRYGVHANLKFDHKINPKTGIITLMSRIDPGHGRHHF